MAKLVVACSALSHRKDTCVCFVDLLERFPPPPYRPGSDPPGVLALRQTAVSLALDLGIRRTALYAQHLVRSSRFAEGVSSLPEKE